MLGDIEAGQELPSKKTHPKSEISRFRYLIEGQSGRLAAMRITDSEIAQLEKNLNTFKQQTRAINLEASAQTDFEFHQLIVEFSGVAPVSRSALVFPRCHYASSADVSLAVLAAWEPVAEHEKIIEALKRRDPDEALYYTRSHIVRSADRLGIADSREIL